MRKLVLVLPLVLGACVTADVSDRVQQIQQTTRSICRFVPTLGTIVDILSKGRTDAITTIARDICAAVTTSPQAGTGRGPLPQVAGVPVRGAFE